MCVDERFADRSRNPDWDKPIQRVQIVLSAFVHNPNIAIYRSVRVGHRSVDLVQFQRRGIVRVVHTDNEL